ncbi:MAG: hypothetical protein BWZ02_02989 [Lentisphaerae bacterium ADurb.BinA184]|nr:MAG: hypothetical protein BWZ02_02989 [Lentisphaerae bacterium ADurb.BinA184]
MVTPSSSADADVTVTTAAADGWAVTATSARGYQAYGVPVSSVLPGTQSDRTTTSVGDNRKPVVRMARTASISGGRTSSAAAVETATEHRRWSRKGKASHTRRYSSFSASNANA